MPSPDAEPRPASGSRVLTIAAAGVAAALVVVLGITGLATVSMLGEHAGAGPTGLPTASAAPTGQPTTGPTAPAAPYPYSLALTPPAGWNSWNDLECSGNTEKAVKAQADALVSSGLAAAGYEYVVVDDCWQGGRDASGALYASKSRFPDGMAALADYVHGKGLKFGIYAVPGSRTCANIFNAYPVTGIGSLGHETQDAKTFASWGVDFLKYDWCRADTTDHLGGKAAFQKMANALKATGRDIVFSLSSFYGSPWTFGAGMANLWRTSHDLKVNWNELVQHVDAQAPLAKYQKPGAWNDPDMLQVGNWLRPIEDQTQIELWAMLGAPLFVGTDIRKLPSSTIGLLKNPEVLAIDRDPSGVQATRVSKSGTTEVWAKKLTNGSTAVVLFNAGESPVKISATLAQLKLSGSFAVRNPVSRKDLAATSSGVSATVAAHGAMLFVLTGAP